MPTPLQVEGRRFTIQLATSVRDLVLPTDPLRLSALFGAEAVGMWTLCCFRSESADVVTLISEGRCSCAPALRLWLAKCRSQDLRERAGRKVTQSGPRLSDRPSSADHSLLPQAMEGTSSVLVLGAILAI